MDINGLDASLLPKDPDMADPSDHVEPKEPKNCEGDCQTFEYVIDIDTREKADEIARK